MSFRDRMRVKVSNAEMALQLELQERGLNRGMATQVGFEFKPEDGVKGTTVDFFWEELRLAVFLDGPHHLKGRQEDKDAKINLALLRRGIRPVRYSYRPPITKAVLFHICGDIEAELKRRIPKAKVAVPSGPTSRHSVGEMPYQIYTI